MVPTVADTRRHLALVCGRAFRKSLVVQTDQMHRAELQALRCVDGHQPDCVDFRPKIGLAQVTIVGEQHDCADPAKRCLRRERSSVGFDLVEEFHKLPYCRAAHVRIDAGVPGKVTQVIAAVE
jgi:hypothetical protein